MAVLTPYRAQLGALRAALRGAGARDDDMRAIDIQTVDGYQVGMGFAASQCSFPMWCAGTV